MKPFLLRQLLNRSGRVVRLVGAHNAANAVIIEQFGFEGVWASSLEISVSHAVPDANILSMSDYLAAASSMNEAVSIPVVADIDQGYGNFANVIYAIRKFESAGMSAVVMEDNIFPKKNSLIKGNRPDLCPVEDFVVKLRAAVDARRSRDFMIIARIEALIAGKGRDAALRRAAAYAAAGADAILIHSNQPDPTEICEFVEAYQEDIPLVVVPTTYVDFTEARISAFPQIRMVIYANHVMRSCVKAIGDTLGRIAADGGIHTLGSTIADTSELFRIQRLDDLERKQTHFRNSVSELEDSDAATV